MGGVGIAYRKGELGIDGRRRRLGVLGRRRRCCCHGVPVFFWGGGSIRLISFGGGVAASIDSHPPILPARSLGFVRWSVVPNMMWCLPFAAESWPLVFVPTAPLTQNPTTHCFPLHQIHRQPQSELRSADRSNRSEAQASSLAAAASDRCSLIASPASYYTHTSTLSSSSSKQQHP